MIVLIGHGLMAAASYAWQASPATLVVITRACGWSSTPRPLDWSPAPLEYWVARSSRAMTLLVGRTQHCWSDRSAGHAAPLLQWLSFHEVRE